MARVHPRSIARIIRLRGGRIPNLSRRRRREKLALLVARVTPPPRRTLASLIPMIYEALDIVSREVFGVLPENSDGRAGRR
jgi:hypothetical protein